MKLYYVGEVSVSLTTRNVTIKELNPFVTKGQDFYQRNVKEIGAMWDNVEYAAIHLDYFIV